VEDEIMPKWGTQDYKQAVFEKLSQGSGNSDTGDEDGFQHFENFSANAPRSDVERGVGEAFHPEKLSSEVTEPQFLRAAEGMQPHERAEIAQDLFDGLNERGLSPSWLQKLLGLGSSSGSETAPEDVARLSEYTRQNHPDVFRRVVADKPFFIRWLDKPLVAALVGVIAGKLINRGYDVYERRS
jgi:hypothetical protein